MNFYVHFLYTHRKIGNYGVGFKNPDRNIQKPTEKLRGFFCA